MKKLLSLPPNLVDNFFDVTELSTDEYFCTCDPIGSRLGSGGGTTWLLEQCYKAKAAVGSSFDEWLATHKRIILHAGGQSRRLPAYAPSGKILTPIPVFRWERGQRLSQNLLTLQLPLYESIMKRTPEHIHTMIVSGDVLIRTTQPLPVIPDADVVCFGLWLDSCVAKNHGVFISERQSPTKLKYMLQKPSVEMLNDLSKDHYFLTDIGVWMLSDKAVKALMARSKDKDNINFYDLYADFGCSLGSEPLFTDSELKNLKIAILPLPGGEFYHFGTSREMISSTLALQNLVNDQRDIIRGINKPVPSIFLQNAEIDINITENNPNLWIENSHLSKGWHIASNHVITGVPENNWSIELKEGQCIDIVPIDSNSFAVRPYHIDDKFSGVLQSSEIFPVVDNVTDMGTVLKEMLTSRNIPYAKEYISAEQIMERANLKRLFEQRRMFRKRNWVEIAKNSDQSVFYQIDLEDAAHIFAKNDIAEPDELSETASLNQRISDKMFRAQLHRLTGKPYQQDEKDAYKLLRSGLTATLTSKQQQPKLAVYSDQIVWARSPVRIDISGGWTDTPPYCLVEGGSVINLSVELNGQPPIQAYIRPCKDLHIILRSIDLGDVETITSYAQLADYIHVGGAFSIPKAALVLAGFLPGYSVTNYQHLQAQLADLGCGFELTLLSAIPAGSGLGTSSILAATVLGALSDFLSLGWDKNEICTRTLILEQMLTTGGGWQDQYGGVLQGVKMLQTNKGFGQCPIVRWLPNDLYTMPEYNKCHLLYYTGITRTAKTILSDIVLKMFLNSNSQLRLLREMKQHTLEMYDAIQRNDFKQMGLNVRTNWEYNQSLDNGTNPDSIKQLTSLIDDLCLGYKLPGAGGGGYLYMVAKDPDAAARIKSILTANSPNNRARFVEMSLSTKGLQISRS